MIKISVVAKPNASLDKISFKDGIFYVKLRAKPVDGEANLGIIRLLSQLFQIPKSKIQILKGTNARNKIIELEIEPSNFEKTCGLIAS